MTTATQAPKCKRADLAWLGLALATHAGLLLLPLGKPDGKPPLPPRLTVELIDWRAQAEPLVDVLPREDLMKPADLMEQPTGPDSAPPESEPVENPSPDRLTAALLMNAAAQPKLPQVEAASRRTLGVRSPRGVPSNWQRGNRAGPPLTDEAELDIVMAPSQTEIVDRWLDAQGAQNVVVTLPNGETFCGRAQAWDPMQPLVEHIMMFRSCGGGGKRSFDMASRPTPRWSTAE